MKYYFTIETQAEMEEGNTRNAVFTQKSTFEFEVSGEEMLNFVHKVLVKDANPQDKKKQERGISYLS